jgi:hypothetical protein
MGTLLNAHPVRQHPTSAPKISKYFACYYAPRSKKGSKQPTSTKKLVSKMLTKCLLIELYHSSIPGNQPAPKNW